MLRGILRRSFSTVRESMAYDVVVVGAGPAGLSTAIKIKQLCASHTDDLSVCVIDKGSEVGAHILSGNVFEPRCINEFLPNWKNDFIEWSKNEGNECNITPVKGDEFHVLTSANSSFKVPNALLPTELHNNGNYIISLSQMVRYLGSVAEELGVEIYPGFAASDVLYSHAPKTVTQLPLSPVMSSYTPSSSPSSSSSSSTPSDYYISNTNNNETSNHHDDGLRVHGVRIRDVGISKTGEKKSTYEAGIDLVARQTIFAEGCRGSCTQDIIKQFNLTTKGNDIQSYALGLKEVWKVPEKNFKEGFVQHTLGWPLQNSLLSKEFGGSFLYHMKPNLVLIGMVIGLDYENPYLNPYQELQTLKHHPLMRQYLKGDSECISYGARCLNEGGYHAIPKLHFPGGLLVGDAAGFINTLKIKGTHTSMKSGLLAAESIFQSLTKDTQHIVAETGEINNNEEAIDINSYESSLYSSWVGKELYKVRNVHSSFKGGVGLGMVYTGLNNWVFRGHEPWQISNKVIDSNKTNKKMKFNKEKFNQKYKKVDNILSFDLLTNLARSGTYHEHDQPIHLRIKENMSSVPYEKSYLEYDGPEQRFCPAGVYEYNYNDKKKEHELTINSQNCIHCKCCSIKMPDNYINWTVPEGGQGPNYTLM